MDEIPCVCFVFVVLVCGLWFCCDVTQSCIHSIYRKVSSHCQHTVANAANSSRAVGLSLVQSLVHAGASHQLIFLKLTMEPVTEQVFCLSVCPLTCHFVCPPIRCHFGKIYSKHQNKHVEYDSTSQSSSTRV